MKKLVAVFAGSFMTAMLLAGGVPSLHAAPQGPHCPQWDCRSVHDCEWGCDICDQEFAVLPGFCAID